MTATNILATERPGRARTLALLVSLLAKLPAPTEILFEDGILRLYLANTADFDAWVAYHGGRIQYRDHRHANTLQCHGNADWCGWTVSLTVCMRIDDDRLSPAEVAEALAAVTE